MTMTRQQARAEQRRIQKHLDAMAKVEASTQRLIDLGVMKKKRKPLITSIKAFVKTLAGRHGKQEAMK